MPNATDLDTQIDFLVLVDRLIKDAESLRSVRDRLLTEARQHGQPPRAERREDDRA